jgi:hypothetical protein
MKDFYTLAKEDAFKHTLPYPNKDDYYLHYVYKQGELVGKFVTTELKKWYKDTFGINTVGSAKSAITNQGYAYDCVIDDDRYKAAMKRYNEEATGITKLFEDCLKEEFGVADNPKFGACLAIAWERGHSNGYHEVYSVFSDIVELIR